MFDVGWGELLLIGVVALIVVGPEDLPRMFHALGRMTAKARAMAREFSAAMDDAARQSGVKEAADSLNEVRTLTSKKSLGLDALDRAAERFEKWDPKRPGEQHGIQPGSKTRTAAAVPGQPLAAVPPIKAAAKTAGASAAPAPATKDLPQGARRQLKAVRRSDHADRPVDDEA